jgi:hypothetical protein
MLMKAIMQRIGASKHLPRCACVIYNTWEEKHISGPDGTIVPHMFLSRLLLMKPKGVPFPHALVTEVSSFLNISSVVMTKWEEALWWALAERIQG